MRVGFIGIGNMGFAMLKGVVGTFGTEQVCYTDVNELAMDKVEAKLGIQGLKTNMDVVSKADVVVLAIKPQYMSEVLASIKGGLTAKHILLTPAVGLTIEYYKKALGIGSRLVRCMPNTPAFVLEGMSAYTYSEDVFSEDEKEVVTKFFESFGKAVEVPEHMIDMVVPVSGSSPAYFFMMLEAMGDAGVLFGLPRDTAYEMAAQTMLGAAKMVLESGSHPGVLKDGVCSPGGTTIEAVKALEKEGFRGMIIEAMTKCYDKTLQISETD